MGRSSTFIAGTGKDNILLFSSLNFFKGVVKDFKVKAFLNEFLLLSKSLVHIVDHDIDIFD